MMLRSMLLGSTALRAAHTESESASSVEDNVAGITALVEAGTIDLATYRGYFEDTHKRETTLTDAELIQVIASMPDAEGEPKPEEFAANMLAAEASELPKEGNGVAFNPVALAVKVGEDKKAMSLLSKAYESKEFLATSAREFYFALVRLLGNNLGNLPKKDTTADGKPLTKNGTATEKSNNPDIYERTAQKVDGGTTVIKGSKVDDFISTLAPIKVMRDSITDAKKKLDASTMSKGAYLAFKKKMEGRLSAMRGVASNAIAVHHQIEACATCSGVVFSWVTDTAKVLDAKGKATDKEHEVPASTTAPVYITNKNKTQEFNQYSIGQFLGFDFAVAKAKGGTYLEVMKTAKRAPTTPNAFIIDKVEAFDGGASTMTNYIENDASFVLVQNYLAKDDGDAAALRLTLQSLANRIDGLLAPHAAWLAKVKTEGGTQSRAKLVAAFKAAKAA